MSLKEIIQQGEKSASEVRQKLLAPRITVTTTETTEQKAAEVVSYEAACLVVLTDALEAITGTRENALQRLRDATALQTIRAAAQAFGAANAQGRTAILMSLIFMQIILGELSERGYQTPLPIDFGQATRATITRTIEPRPSIWAERFPGQPEPTLAQIRAEITRRAAS